MKYYLNNSLGKKILHTEKCPLSKKYARDGIRTKTWFEFKTLKEAQKFCRESGYTYHYCGRCMKKFNKAKVK